MAEPMQPVYFDAHGTLRFKANEICRWLVDSGRVNLNELAVMPGISDEDRAQFAQLIGYSVSGYGELSYVSDRSYARAAMRGERLRQKQEGQADA